MSKDLGLTANQYYNCLMMFCEFSAQSAAASPNAPPVVGYIIFMFPGNIGLKVIRPNIILGGACLLFGAFLVSTSAAQNYATVLSMRILLGATQAFIQGLGLYVTIWYRRDEVATRSGKSYYIWPASASDSYVRIIKLIFVVK
jgi:hypothetical protein